jgi:hypothetical protein
MNTANEVERSGPAPIVAHEQGADSFVVGGAVGGSRRRASSVAIEAVPRAERQSRANVRFAFKIDDPIAA